MPFVDRITNGMSPHRVFSLCKLVHYFQHEEMKELTKEKAGDFLQPNALMKEKTQFREVLQFARSGNLVTENEDQVLTTNLTKEDLSSIEHFKRAIIARAIENKELMFWKFTSWYVMRDNRVLNEKTKDLETTFNQELNTEQDATFIYNETNINGWRTWAVFLGYGFLHAGIVLPNLAVRLNNLLIEDHKLQRNQYLPMADFMEWLRDAAPEVDGGTLGEMYRGKSSLSAQHLSLGLSTGLRALHDQNVITLNYVRDARDTWHLTRAPFHEITGQVSQIMIRSEG
ncbi:hypothetical protein [Peribacillus simplex]|uniref:hypothetical protein n=1 Tax=Peribacillus simplex TaxID=1478 RepID=UPI0011A676FA|nr:hypothetical protein [Peribacillus simplex]